MPNPDGSPNGVRDAGSVSLIAGVSSELDFTDLTPKELTTFDRDLMSLSNYYDKARDLRTLFLEDRDTFLWAASIAKKQLAIGFGGSVAGSGQFGMQLIRSKTILGASDWLQSYAAAGWQTAVFGSSASPVDFSTTSTTYGNPQNRVLAIITKLYCTTLPKITEIYFHVGATDYPIWPISFRGVGDLFVAGLPASVLVNKNSKFYMLGNVGSAIGVVDGTAPLGLTFCLAEYMTGSGQQ